MHVIHARDDPRLARLPLERGPPACILRREAEIRRLSHQQAIRSGFQSHLEMERYGISCLSLVVTLRAVHRC
jgi:hypothetical protein